MSSFRSRAALQLEILALRHQLGVLQRSVKRPKLTAADRFLWAWLAAVWTDWQPSSIIIKPATVIGWHRKGFRLFWTWKIQRGKPGRPAVPADVRSLIRTMSRDNPLWGAPRIHGELLKLGIAVGEIGVGHTGTSPRPIGGHGAGYCDAGSRRPASSLRAPRRVTTSSARFYPHGSVLLRGAHERSLRPRW